jgi:hypothetical protein
VQNSRVCGDISSGNDTEKYKEELEWRARWVWDLDADRMVKDAVKQLVKSLEEREMEVRLAKM